MWKTVITIISNSNNKNNNNNSPGLRPIGVLDPLQGCVSKFPDRAKWAPQGRRRRKSVRSGRGHLGSIGGRVMAPCDLRWILTTQLRSPLKMQRFEPSIDLDFANGFCGKGCQLHNYFFGTFQPSSMRARDTVEMQGFELVAILVATSDLQNFVQGSLRAPKEPSGPHVGLRNPWETARRPQDRSSAFLRWILSKSAWYTQNMQRFWPSHLVL